MRADRWRGWRRSWLVLALASGVGLGACRDAPAPSVRRGATSAAQSSATATGAPSSVSALPALPSLASSAPGVRLPQAPPTRKATWLGFDEASVTGSELADDGDVCGTCHGGVTAQWKTSGHAWASFTNPIYAASALSFRRERGSERAEFCGGCHDLALVRDGLMGAPSVMTDKRSAVGVGCRACHGATPRIDGNGSVTLGAAHPRGHEAFPDGAIPSEVEAHRKHFAAKASSTEMLCASCHRSFLGEHTGLRGPSGQPHHVPGLATYDQWLASAYSGNDPEFVGSNVKRATCRDCHMPAVLAPEPDVAANGAGLIASHEFLGGHTWLDAMRGDTGRKNRTATRLKAAVRVRIPVIEVLTNAEAATGGVFFEPADVAAGVVANAASVVVHAVVSNDGVGHAFPGGIRDAQEVWLSCRFRDRAGHVYGSASSAESQNHPTAADHVFRVGMVNEKGELVRDRRVESFAAPVFDQTIGARGSRVVRFGWVPPKDVQWPVVAEVRLLHRSRARETQAEACRAQVAGPLGGGLACAPQPVTVLGEVTVSLGAIAARSRPAALTERLVGLVSHGRAWRRGLDEDLDRAKFSLNRALEMMPSALGKGELGHYQDLRVLALVSLADVAGRQGRTDEMSQLLGQLPAERAMAGNSVRAAALARTFRYEQAADALAELAPRVPGNVSVWSRLAIAWGTSDRPSAALWASHQVLLLAPRHEAGLRSQLLSLRRKRAPDEAIHAAESAYLTHRSRDDLPSLRSTCSRVSEVCALERTPLHIHWLPSADDQDVRKIR